MKNVPPKIKKVCATCGSEDMVWDAYARWDVETQDYVLSSNESDCLPVCGSCGDEDESVDVEIPG